MKAPFLLFVLFMHLGVCPVLWAEEPTQNPTQTEPTLPPVPEQIQLTDLFLFLDHQSANKCLSSIAEKKYPEAVSQLKDLIDKRTSPVTKSALHTLMGLISLKAHDAANAEVFLKQALLDSPILKDYATYLLIQSLNRQAKYTEALTLFPASSTPTRLVDNSFYWEKINTLLLNKNFEEAFLLLNIRKKEFAKDLDEQIKIKFTLGKRQWLMGNKTDAVNIWKELLIKDAGSAFEIDIFETLIKDYPAEEKILANHEWIARADSLMEKDMAYMAYPIYLRLDTPANNLKLKIAEAAFKAKKYPEAAKLYQQLWDNPTGKEDRGQILSRLASSYTRSDDFERAIKYTKMRLKLPEKEGATEASTKLAFLYFDSGDYKKAKSAYSQLASKSKGKPKLAALWKKFWIHTILNEHKNALDDLDEYEKNNTDKKEKGKINYWRARTLEHLGKKQEARLLYGEIKSKEPQDYYGFLSAERLKSGGTHNLILAPPQNKEATSFYNRLNFSNHFSLSSSDPLVVAILLAQAGLYDYAIDEANQSPLLSEKFDSSLLPYLLLTQFYQKIHTLGLTLVKVGNETFGSQAWKMSYPTAYQFWVEFFGKKFDLSTYLTWSIMRQESAFRPKITSPANAIGLMQIIPQTGQELAKILGEHEFHHDDLKDPITNIEFGMRYLKDRQNEFNGNLPYAIASYNAGPNAVNRWKKWGDRMEFDEFIELIPYNETNNYVKKVLRNYWIYKQLYQ